MSHFFTGIILPKSFSPSAKGNFTKTHLKNIREYVASVLGPYDENMDVPGYEVTCDCIESKASNLASDARDREFGSIDQIRKKFFNDHPEWKDPASYGEGEGEKCDEAWQARIRPMIEFEEKEKALQLTKVKPDVECEYCRGTGKRVSTYNPKSKWDWWVIGGRWDGMIQGDYRESEDNGFNFGDDHHQLKYNISSVPSLLKHPNSIPFALVLPDGEWAEKGEMGWWGMVSNEKKRTDWESQVVELLTKYADHYIVGCDLHI